MFSKKIFLTTGIILKMMLFFLYLVFVFLPQGTSAATIPFASGTYVPGEVLIQYDQDTFDAHQIAIHNAESPSSLSSDDPVQVVKDFFVKKTYAPLVGDTFYESQAQLIILDKSGEPLTFMSDLANLEGVVHVQPNFLYKLETSVNDPWFPKPHSPVFNKQNNMWHLRNTQVYDPSSTSDAWDLIGSLTSTSRPRVAVIDDGILTSYGDFSFPKKWECKIPEFNRRFFRVAGGDEKVEYTPKTMQCDRGGIGFNKKTIGYSINTIVDHANLGDFHGTQVSSVFVANRHNNALGAGVVSSNREIELIPIRARTKNSKLDSVTLMRAIAFARLNSIDIINASFGEMHSKGSCGDHIDRLTHKQIERFGKEADGLFVVAVGNNDSKIGTKTSANFPSDFNHTISGCDKWSGLSNIIAVGGTEQSGGGDSTTPIAENDVNGDGRQSNVEKDLMSVNGVVQEIRYRDKDVGEWSGSNYGSHVNIAAPAKTIIVPESALNASSPFFANGTSLAAPQVAGTLALMKYANSALTASQLKQKLEESADELISLVGPDCTPGTSDDYVKNGRRLNAYNAVQAARDRSYTKKTITNTEIEACKACEGGTQTWTVGGYTCEADLPLVVQYKAEHTITDSVGNTAGKATYSCTRNDGLLTISNRTCGPAQCPLAVPNKPDVTEGIGKCTLNDNDRGSSEYRVAVLSGGVPVSQPVETTLPYTFENLTPGTFYSFSVQRKNPHSTCTTWSKPNSVAHCTPKAPSCTHCITDLEDLTNTTTERDTWVDTCDSESRYARYAHYYTFTLKTEAEVTIDLESSVDTYLLLHQYRSSNQCRVGTEIESDDDGGTGTNSRITRRLSAGTYTIEASTFYGYETGSFTLKITLPDDGGGGGCTNATIPTATATPGNKECTIAKTSPGNDYTYQIKKGNGGWITGPSHTFKNLTNDTEYTFSVQRRNTDGACTNWSGAREVRCTPTGPCTGNNVCGCNSSSPYCSNGNVRECYCTVSGNSCIKAYTTTTCSYGCSAGSCDSSFPCTSCATWNAWTPTITNQCGNVDQERTCETKAPAGCTGAIAPQTRTRTISPTGGGWSTLPGESSVACGTTQTAICNNPAPSCGGACSGVAPTVTGTKCSSGHTCSGGSCVPSCTTATTPPTFTITEGNTTLRATFTLDTRNYAYERAISSSSSTCAGSTWGSESNGYQNYSNLTNDTTYYVCLRRRNNSGSCTSWSSSRVVSGTPSAPALVCTSCATWNAWTPTITNQCGNVDQERTCETKAPAGCTGAIAPETRTRTISPTGGGWSTLPGESSVACGTTQTATCTNPAPSCGGTCSGTAPTVTGTKCSGNQGCTNGLCGSTPPTCTSCATWNAWANTSSTRCGNVPQRRTCETKAPAGCTGAIAPETRTRTISPTNGGWSTLPGESSVACGTTQTATCTNPAPSCGGTCSGTAPTVTGTKCSGNQGCTNGLCGSTPPTCTSCATWNAWANTSSTRCGNVPQRRTCETKAPAGCTGAIAPETRTRTVPAVNGGWSSWSSWGSCTCTPSILDRATTGTQARTRTCTNPAPSCGGNSCAGASRATRPCATSGCAVVAPLCSWQRVSCGSKACGPQQAICGPYNCSSTCAYTGGRRAQPGAVGTFTNGCGTCTGGKTCNTSGQCVTTRVNGGWSAWSACSCTPSTSDATTAGRQTRTCTNPRPSGGGSACSGPSSQSCSTSGCYRRPPVVSCTWQGNDCTGKCGTITGTCGPTGCTGTCPYSNGTRAQPGATGTRNCGGCSSGYTCSSNTCVANPTCKNWEVLYNGSCVRRCGRCVGGQITCVNGTVTRAWGWKSFYNGSSCGGCGKQGDAC